MDGSVVLSAGAEVEGFLAGSSSDGRGEKARARDGVTARLTYRTGADSRIASQRSDGFGRLPGMVKRLAAEELIGIVQSYLTVSSLGLVDSLRGKRVCADSGRVRGSLRLGHDHRL
jgi:hypothetical protein